MSTAFDYLCLAQGCNEISTLLMHAYRMPNGHPNSPAEQRLLTYVQEVLEEAFTEAARILNPLATGRGTFYLYIQPSSPEKAAPAPAPEPPEPGSSSQKVRP